MVGGGMQGGKIRILFHLSHFGRGGTETSLINWIRALDGKRFSPSVSVTWPSEALDFWIGHSLPSDVPVHVLTNNSWINYLNRTARERKLSVWEKIALKLLTYLLARPSFSWAYRRLARDHDVIVDFDCSLRHLAGRFGKPWIGVSHYSFSARLAGKSSSYVRRRMRHYARYNVLAVLTPSMHRELKEWMGPRRIKIRELPNVFDVSNLRQLASVPPPILPEDFFISVARLDKTQKDYETLLKSFALMHRSETSNVALLLVGDGPDREYLQRLAKELGIDGKVHFLGFNKNPFPLIRAAKALILSSRYEGMPMVLVEAMALGTPVISSDCPVGPHDLLEGGKNGVLTPVGDVETMTAAMTRLLHDSALREKYSANGLVRAEEFSPSKANQRMLALMDELLKRRDPSSSPMGEIQGAKS